MSKNFVFFKVLLKVVNFLKPAVVSLTAAAILSAFPVFSPALNVDIFQNVMVNAAEEDGPRPPPASRSSQTLTRPVFARITEVMELRDAENFTEALEVLDEVKEMYDRGRLNDFEIFTMWQFYANLAQLQDNYPLALDYYEEMVALPDLTADRLEQAWSLIGSLNFILENYEEAIEAFNNYLNVAESPDDAIYLRIGQAYYQLEQYTQAIPYVIENMEVVRAKMEVVPQSTYALLRALYLTIEDYGNARQILREMVVLFNDPEDWGYLAAINGQLERFTEQAYNYYVADVMGYLDSESQLVNLAAQLYNSDNPYGAGKILERGMADGIIEENESNLSFLSQCWQIAREDERAAPPLEKAAEMSDDGELYVRLGRIYLTMNEYEKAIEAFNNALDSGEVDRPDQLYLSMASAFMQLNEFDEALEAATEAATDERSRESASTWITVLQNEKKAYESNLQRIRDYPEFFKPNDQVLRLAQDD